MGKLVVNDNRSLKLTNVLLYKLNLLEDENIDLLIEQMKSYISVKGVKQVGPLIQHTCTFVNTSDKVEIEIILILQCSNYIHNVELPYKSESLLKIKNCMYCRYIGPEEKLNLAYDKIQVEAFEKDIPLKGDSYTIFVDRDDENETITADVFMERADS